MSSRRRPRRHADRDGLWPRGRRDLGRRGRGDLRRQGAARDQPAHRPCSGHRPAREHAIFGPKAETLARAFWPGPLTLVLPVASTSRISLLARAGLDTVAIRSPSHETARALIEAAGVPLAAPSANRSGAVSPTTAAHVVSELDGRVDWILDGGPCRHGLEFDDRRLSRQSAPIAAPGRDNPRGDRIRARFADRTRRAPREPPRTRPGNWRRTMRPRLRFDSARRAPRRRKPRSISAARSRAARLARKSIFRRPQTLSRPRRICFPIFARWTAPARRGSRSRRSRSMGLGRRSTIGSAVQLLRETK